MAYNPILKIEYNANPTEQVDVQCPLDDTTLEKYESSCQRKYHCPACGNNYPYGVTNADTESLRTEAAKYVRAATRASVVRLTEAEVIRDKNILSIAHSRGLDYLVGEDGLK